MSPEDPQVPDFLPPEFEVISSRKLVSAMADDERRAVRDFWVNEDVPDMPHYLRDQHLQRWAELDLVVRYIPERTLPAEWLVNLPYGLTSASAKRLEEGTPETFDPFQMEGGWYLMPVKGLGIDELDALVVSHELEGDSEIHKPPARVMDYLRGAQALYNLARVKVAPRYPRATELVYLRNAGNGSAESEDTLELCIDPIHTSERVEHLAIDYSTKKARLHRVGSFEQFPGVVRPIWPLPDGRNLILSKDRDIVL